MGIYPIGLFLQNNKPSKRIIPIRMDFILVEFKELFKCLAARMSYLKCWEWTYTNRLVVISLNSWVRNWPDFSDMNAINVKKSHPTTVTAMSAASLSKGIREVKAKELRDRLGTYRTQVLHTAACMRRVLRKIWAWCFLRESALSIYPWSPGASLDENSSIMKNPRPVMNWAMPLNSEGSVICLKNPSSSSSLTALTSKCMWMTVLNMFQYSLYRVTHNGFKTVLRLYKAATRNPPPVGGGSSNTWKREDWTLMICVWNSWTDCRVW